MIKAVLVLEDGTTFRGVGFGYPTEVSGEVVFNTGMVGYPDSLTDPSYRGQILVQTYPLIGNYGVPSPSVTNPQGVPLYFESSEIQVTGYAISSLSKIASHWASTRTLNDWLVEEIIPGVERIDTRMLTKKLRTKGVMLGVLKISEEIDMDELKEKARNVQDPNEKDLVSEVTIPKPISHESYGSASGVPRIVVIDCGAKFGIIRSLLERKLDVVRVPYDYSTDEIMKFDPDGILISNGPGDPKRSVKTIKSVKGLMELKIPIFGICYGIQILALAAGADTYKLKFGHRGQNHPAIDLRTRKCFITSQNHGFAVEKSSLSGTGFEVSMINANDKTIEGIVHKNNLWSAVQFHPEASPGPFETEYLFDKFVKSVRKGM